LVEQVRVPGDFRVVSSDAGELNRDAAGLEGDARRLEVGDAASGASKSGSVSKPTSRASRSSLASPAAVETGYLAVGLTVPPWVGTSAFASVWAPS